MPLPRPQTTRPRVSIRTRWRVARLMLRAGVGRVQLMLMPLPHAQMCVEWSVCAAVEPADDAAAALSEQKIVASREADAACRRRSREADATATLRCVEWSVCGTMCDVCWPSGSTCAVSGSSRDIRAPEMSGRSLRCQYGCGVYCARCRCFVKSVLCNTNTVAIFCSCSWKTPAVHERIAIFLLFPECFDVYRVF